ncbi:MAG TPA: large-conductance mechanosensitive channel protein MscL [Bacteroidales bacterium]|nr:large-conductance mechanosensitive channel protein MscL [Bacteroidales bacterium]
MSIVKEFRDFAMKGNVADMAVGIIIGAAFGKIVSSIVNDVIMPPLGLLIGGVDFTELTLTLKEASVDQAGNVINAVTLNWGNFVQTTFDFLIVAFAIFILIKAINNLKKKEEVIQAAPPEPSKEEKLLTEIRDLLKK